MQLTLSHRATAGATDSTVNILLIVCRVVNAELVAKMTINSTLIQFQKHVYYAVCFLNIFEFST